MKKKYIETQNFDLAIDVLSGANSFQRHHSSLQLNVYNRQMSASQKLSEIEGIHIQDRGQ